MGSFNIDAYKNFVNGNNNNGYSYTSTTSINGNPFGCGGGSTFNSIFSGVMGLAQLAVCYAVQPGASGGGGSIDNKTISTAVNQVIAEYPAKIGTEISNFNSKYGDYGISINGDGVLTGKNYATAKADIENQVAKLKASVQSDGKDPESVKNYVAAQAKYNGLSQNLTMYESYETQINNFNKANIEIDSSGLAKAKPPLANDYKQYLEDPKNGKPEETQAYKNQLAANQREADSYNNLVKQKNNCLGNEFKTKDELKLAIDKAKEEMETAGKANANSSMTASSYQSSLDGLTNKLTALGTEADFNASVKKVTDLVATYNDALDVQKSSIEAREADNAVKNSKKLDKNGNSRGFFRRLFGRGKTDNYKKKVEMKNQKQDSYNNNLVAFYEKYKS